MIFDVLHCALLTAEKAVKVMKQREMEEDEKALNSVEGNITLRPDTADNRGRSTPRKFG